MKNFFYLIVIVLLIFYPNVLNANKLDENSKAIKEISEKIGLDLKEIVIYNNITKIKIGIVNWSGDYGHYNQFPNENKKKQIRNTLAVVIGAHFSSGLGMQIQIGKFKTIEDALLGYYDVYGFSDAINKTLFSGETIENALVITQSYANRKVIAFLNYKNYVCKFNFGKFDDVLSNSKLPEVLSTNDLKQIDEIIKLVKKILIIQ